MSSGDRVAVWRVSGDPKILEVHPNQRNGSSALKILISAAEASSDAHGAKLLEAIRKRAGEPVDAFGIGGPRLQAAGLRTVVDARELLVMGFGEILSRIPQIFRALGRISDAAASERPDIAVVIDYPDFHFRLAKRLRRLGVPVVYFIPPKVWVWRKSRVRFLKEYFSKLLCIFPFEEGFYRGEGISVKYVGNPLVDELPMSMTRAEARAKTQVPTESVALVLMPGSRPSELKRHLEPMLGAALRCAEGLIRLGKLANGERLQVLIPLPDTADLEGIRSRVNKWALSAGAASIQVRISSGDSAVCLLAADAGLIKSGTSTLEAALLGCPCAVVYKPAPLTGFIVQTLVGYRGPVGLVNLVAGVRKGEAYLAREILCDEFTEAALAEEALSLLTDEGKRTRMQGAFSDLRRSILDTPEGKSPSTVAADEIIALVKGSR